MPISCPSCAAQMPDTAAFCPGCGRSMLPVERAQGTVGVLPETFAGALAYFLLPAIVFLFVEPYKNNRFVRFHSFQCLGVYLASVVVVAIFTLLVVLFVKAMQGEMFKLPLLGDFAEGNASPG